MTSARSNSVIERRKLAWPWRILHGLIIVNLLVEIFYCTWMVFCVLAPSGGGPLGRSALELPFETMATRRMYALEAWVAMVGLSLYLGLTEIAPRLWLKVSDRGAE